MGSLCAWTAEGPVFWESYDLGNRCTCHFHQYRMLNGDRELVTVALTGARDAWKHLGGGGALAILRRDAWKHLGGALAILRRPQGLCCHIVWGIKGGD